MIGSIGRIIILLNQVPNSFRKLLVLWTQIMLVPIYDGKEISRCGIKIFSQTMSVKGKRKKKVVRGIIKIDGVVKCPASQRCCVSKSLAEFC